jgi:hypothetical protein
MAPLLERAAALANHGLFFEVHELLEPVWFRASEPARTALQGLIQVAVAFHHLENGNLEGARSLLVGVARWRGGALPRAEVAGSCEPCSPPGSPTAFRWPPWYDAFRPDPAIGPRSLMALCW